MGIWLLLGRLMVCVVWWEACMVCVLCGIEI